MIVHHLNCGTMCPVGGRLMDGPGRGPGPARLVCHCLLIESERDGLVLVDTGLGLRDVRRPRPRLDGTFLSIMRLPLREEETAVRQIERLGYRASDVRHIVLTHLDFDHAGGLEDFPDATVHVLEAEHHAAAGSRSGFVARGRYRPMQWDEV
jgi:glyoxylase-like metal-dependent hydrolase (beta-lactamase superfamily II)